MPTDPAAVREGTEEFVNELGNRITLSVAHDDRGVTHTIAGPTSMIENTLTPMEAQRLCVRLAPPGTVVVELPAPEPVDREFQPGARFDGIVEASIRCDGAVFLDSGVQGYRTPEQARRYGAALLAAAAWVDSRAATPPPDSGADLGGGHR